MIKKTTIILLLGCLFSARAQTQQSIFKLKQFGIYAGVGLTNAFENNTKNIWQGKVQNQPYTFISEPSFELGINYKIPVVKGYASFESELGFMSGSNIQIFEYFSNVFYKYNNQFNSINIKTLAVFDLPLVRESETLIFGFGPTINYSTDSKTNLTSESTGQSGKVYLQNLLSRPYSNKLFLGAKAYIGISIKQSIIKFNYNYLKLNSDDNLLPIHPFYTLGITYEHKIF